MVNKNKKLGVALAGLGWYASDQIAPAFAHTENCYLAGIVTGDESKASLWKMKYNLPAENVYNYKNFDSIKDNQEIDIVYIILPHHLHAEYAVRAFEAGKHVICEKPMATSVNECRVMINAAQKTGRLLSVGYRLPFDPYHKEMIRLGTGNIYGNIKKISGGFGFLADPGNWRWKKEEAGGGPLVDVGIYVIQAMCYISGKEPIAVTAVQRKNIDNDINVEESISWRFEFPDGMTGEGKASFTEDLNFLKVEAEDGVFELSEAFHYNGIKGKSPGGEFQFAPMNQQAAMLDNFSLAIFGKVPNIVPGEMGERDARYMEAIYESARTGKRILI